MNLKEVALNDKEWRAYTFTICKDKDLTHDIVQNMYLKVNEIDKDIDKFYILAMLRNSLINHYKKQSKKKEVSLELTKEIQNNYTDYEPTDNEIQIFNNFKKQKWYRQILIEESYDTSIRKIADKYNINYGFVFREIKEARKEILKNEI